MKVTRPIVICLYIKNYSCYAGLVQYEIARLLKLQNMMMTNKLTYDTFIMFNYVRRKRGEVGAIEYVFIQRLQIFRFFRYG